MNDGWTTASNVCNPDGSGIWWGVTCDMDMQVISIELGENNVFGTIPREIQGLSALKKYDANKNSLYGVIPFTIGQLANLGTFVSPWYDLPVTCEEILTLPHLALVSSEFFDLFTNFIGVDEQQNPVPNALPSSIGNLTKLETLNLNANFITGTLPITSLLSMSSLRFLDLFFNEFTGSIPSSLGTLTKLEYLDLSQNVLIGSLPTELGLMTNLTDLRIAKTDSREVPDGLCEPNCLGGAIPTEIGNLRNLRE